MLEREGPASLATLPTEIADTIYYSLTPDTLTRLARVSKDIYAAVQGPLYRRPVINSYKKLQAFVKTLNNVASWDLRSGDARSKSIVYLMLSIDPAKEETTTGKPLIAVLLARMIGVVARYNPRVAITLEIVQSACDAQPVRSFESEKFPRVTNLILNLGGDPGAQPSAGRLSGGNSSSSLSTVIPRRRHIGAPGYDYNASGRRCVPSAKFWTRFFNGISFPDLQQLELHHNSPTSYGFEGWEGERILFTELDTVGLTRVERLVVDTVPEFNDAVLMAGLQHAPLLTDLQLIDCSVTYEALDKLLLHALPVLQRLVLRVSPRSRFSRHVRELLNTRGMRNSKEPIPHLCPHFRKSGKNLKYLEFSAPFICRDLFLDDYEKAKLHEAGHPGPLSGDDTGKIAQGELDVRLVTGILKGIRQVRETDTGGQKMAEGNSIEEDRKLLEKERLLRNRRATIEREGWERKLHMLDGPCWDGDTFDELGALIEVEEPGITWTVGSKQESKAVKCINGVARLSSYRREFGRDRSNRRGQIERDVNDELAGH